MFNLKDYIQNTIVNQETSSCDSNGNYTINIDMKIDDDQIVQDCDSLKEILRNLHNLLEEDYVIVVNDNETKLIVGI